MGNLWRDHLVVTKKLCAVWRLLKVNLIVHVHRGVEEHGYDLGTRQSWRCGKRANDVTRVIGVIKGQVVSVIDGVYAELSTPENNPVHRIACEGRFIFLGGECWSKCDDASERHEFMSKKIHGLGQNFRYMTDEELFQRLR